MHRRRRCSRTDDGVTSRNTYHEIENDDDDEDETTSRHHHHQPQDGHFQGSLPSGQEPGSSRYHYNDDHNHDHEYRQREFEQPGQSRQQNTRAFVHSEAHPEPAAEGALLRQRERSPEQRRPGQSGLGAGFVGRKAQSGRAVKSARDEDQEVILDDKSVAEMSED